MWCAVYRCKSCKHMMSHWTMMYSHGVCPWCGSNDNGNSGTVVACDEGARQWVANDPKARWWTFWRSRKGKWDYMWPSEKETADAQ